MLLRTEACAQTLMELAGEADSAMAGERWEEASVLLRKAIGLNPDNPSNVLMESNLGLTYYHLGLDSLALATLDEAVAKAPRSRTILRNRAEVRAALGLMEESYSDFSQLVALQPDSAGTRCIRALMALELGDSATAGADCDRLASAKPGDDASREEISSVLTACGRWEEALPLLSDMIASSPTPGRYAAHAVACMMTGRLNEASADITMGLEIDPDCSELYLYRAYLNRLRYRPDDARKDLLKALRHNNP